MRTDQVVIVTGAARGLGFAMAVALIDAGRRVVAVDVRPCDELLAYAQAHDGGDRLLVRSASIRDEDSCEAVVAAARERFGSVDALINNAALGVGELVRDPAQPLRFYDVPGTAWRNLIDTNVTGTFLMTRAVVGGLIAQGWGRIVNITTSYSTMKRGEMSPYGPSKAAIEAMTHAWAEDLAGTGVTANVLIPGGASDTPFVPYDAVPDRSTLISPDVMKAPAIWLTSEASDGVTGMRIIGRNWNAGDADSVNRARAMTPAAWPLQLGV